MAETIAHVAEHGPPTQALPGVQPAGPSELSGEPQPPATLESLEVHRDDPAERWLVRMLLAVEDDLHEIDEPMIFGCYGRGRAMEPYLGEGITQENLLMLIGYMTGSCSCEIKELNPGMDLLTAWDWEASAEKMALRQGEEEGNRDYLEPEDLLSSIVSMSDAASEAEGGEKQSAETEETVVALAQADEAQPDSTADTAATHVDAQTAPAVDPVQPDITLVWWMAGGLLAICLMLGTLALVRFAG
jgi:hypothetical protein